MDKETLPSPEPPVNLMEAVRNGSDISALTPRQLADYHLAVTALQLEGREVFLSDEIHIVASELVARTHYDLAIASGDALSKELIPGGIGGTIQGYPADQTEAVREIVRAYQTARTYEAYVPPQFEIGVGGQLRMNRDFVGLAYAMRQALRAHRDNPSVALSIVADIAHLARVYFTEQRRLNKGPLKPRKRGWKEFAEGVDEYLTALAGGDPNQIVVYANMKILNAVHEGGSAENPQPMVMRFANSHLDPDKSGAYVDTLDATRGSYEDLLAYAGYVGRSLYPYLTGRKHSPAGPASSWSLSATYRHQGD